MQEQTIVYICECKGDSRLLGGERRLTLTELRQKQGLTTGQYENGDTTPTEREEGELIPYD